MTSVEQFRAPENEPKNEGEDIIRRFEETKKMLDRSNKDKGPEPVAEKKEEGIAEKKDTKPSGNVVVDEETARRTMEEVVAKREAQKKFYDTVRAKMVALHKIVEPIEKDLAAAKLRLEKSKKTGPEQEALEDEVKNISVDRLEAIDAFLKGLMDDINGAGTPQEAEEARAIFEEARKRLGLTEVTEE
jgi:hypothetical protein